MATTDNNSAHQNQAQREWVQEVQLRCNSPYIPRNNKRHRSIYRLPESVKTDSKSHYNPKIVKLGLLHHDIVNLPLSQIEEMKVEAVQKMVERLNRNSKTIEDLIQEIHNLDIRKFYDAETPTKWDEDVVAWRLIMDGCFILEFFSLGNIEEFLRLERWDMFDDIFKLENQIPLVVLVKILELEIGTHDGALQSLAKDLYMYPPFQGIPFSLNSECENVKSGIDSADHLLDLVHGMVVLFLTGPIERVTQFTVPPPPPAPAPILPPENLHEFTPPPPPAAFLPPENLHELTVRCAPFLPPENLDELTVRCAPFLPPENSHELTDRCAPILPPENLHEDHLRSHNQYHIQSAENLQKEGIKFRPSENGEVKFQKGSVRRGILYLPQIYVDHDTEALLRNLMAFDCEKSARKEERGIICQLMILMNCLIQTRKDVAILRKEGILCSRIGSDEDLAPLFSNLCKGIPDYIPYYQKKIIPLNDHCNKKLNKDQWIAWYKQYLSKPWNILSLVVAAIFLALTAIQTYYTVKSYNREKPN